MVAHYDFTVIVGVTVDFMVTLHKTKQGHLSKSQQIVICGATLWEPKAWTISCLAGKQMHNSQKSPKSCLENSGF